MPDTASAPAVGAKLMFVVYRRPEITHEDFLARWRDRQHLSLVEKVPGLTRHLHDEAIELPFAGAPDGIGELWYPDAAALNASLTSPEFGAAAEDGKRFADMEKTYAFSVREAPIFDRARGTQDVIEQHWTYWSAHDLDRLLPLFTDDVVYEDVTMGVVNRGRSQLRAFAEAFLSGFPDITFELKSSVANGAGAAAPNGSCAARTGAICPACRQPVSGWRCAARRRSNSTAGGFDAARTTGIWRPSSASSV